ncbi:RNA polymerase II TRANSCRIPTIONAL COACTIVATOR [Salix viminalis]|uniref:RNA polymerase II TRANSCRIPTIONAL COACTIVATOR n=1 Tax=Salix viminalis TaxID=40686 RepID=A0A6N2M449_SALVM|nr:RNA polymerase II TRANSCRIPTIONAL COACTIVATOR [Salix viminalis]
MEHKLRMQIKETVREILEESDMETTTEHQIRRLASNKLDLDLDKSEYKAYVRHVVNSYLEEQKAKQEDDEEETGKQEQEYDDEGNLVICRLSAKRKVTIQNFRGANLVSIREYYYDGGAERPTAKGISLNEEQWSALRRNIPAIEKAVKDMQDRDN